MFSSLRVFNLPIGGHFHTQKEYRGRFGSFAVAEISDRDVNACRYNPILSPSCARPARAYVKMNLKRDCQATEEYNPGTKG